MHLAGLGTLNLNSTDAFCQINADKGIIAEQSEMTLNLSRHYNDKAADPTKAEYGVYAADVKLNLGADNNWGAFSFGSDVKLTLTLNNFSLVLGEVNTQSGANGNFTFMLNDYYDLNNNFRIVDMTEADIKNIKFYDSAEVLLVEGLDYFVTKASGGGYWINSTIPEPAEWASLFGALALGFAIYRRRK